MTISVSKHIRHRPCSSTYCNRHATQFYESLTLLFSAASPQFALHFPFDSPEIASPTPCVQYMTRTNAENHFATLSPDSVSKWYAASRRWPGCLILPSAAKADACGRLLNRLLGSAHPRSGHFRQIRDFRRRFSFAVGSKSGHPIPCSINDENSGRTQIATSNVLSIVQNQPNIRHNPR